MDDELVDIVYRFILKYIPKSERRKMAFEIVKIYDEYNDYMDHFMNLLNDTNFYNKDCNIVFEKVYNYYHKLFAGESLNKKEINLLCMVLVLFGKYRHSHCIDESDIFCFVTLQIEYENDLLTEDNVNDSYEFNLKNDLYVIKHIFKLNNYIKQAEENNNITTKITKNLKKYLSKNKINFYFNVDDEEYMDVINYVNYNIIDQLNNVLSIDIKFINDNMFGVDNLDIEISEYIINQLDLCYKKVREQEILDNKIKQNIKIYNNNTNLKEIIDYKTVVNSNDSSFLVLLCKHQNYILNVLNMLGYENLYINNIIKEKIEKCGLKIFMDSYQEIICEKISQYIYNFILKNKILLLTNNIESDLTRINNMVKNKNIVINTIDDINNLTIEFIIKRFDELLNNYLFDFYNEKAIDLVSDELKKSIKNDCKYILSLILNNDDTFTISGIIFDVFQSNINLNYKITNIKNIKQTIINLDVEKFEKLVTDGLSCYDSLSQKAIYLNYIKDECIGCTNTKIKLLMSSYIDNLIKHNIEIENSIITSQVSNLSKTRKGGYILFSKSDITDISSVSKKYCNQQEKYMYFKYIRESLNLLIMSSFLDIDLKNVTTLYTEKYIDINAIKIKDAGYNSRFKVRLIYNNLTNGNCLIQRVFDRTSDSYNRNIKEFESKYLQTNISFAEESLDSKKEVKRIKYIFENIDKLSKIYQLLFNNLNLEETEKDNDLNLLSLIYSKFYNDVIDFSNSKIGKQNLKFIKNILSQFKCLVTEMHLNIDLIKEKSVLMKQII